MASLQASPWFPLLAIGLAGLLCGWVLGLVRGQLGERAAAARVAKLCEQLDAQDRKLHGLRNDLRAAQLNALELQAALDVRHTVSALRLEENEDPAFFRRLVRAL
ncbi:MAG: hypothetical protein AD742_07740 [Methylibium sp. NZG]|nr:MAG: hypothetical protein AD742_07740 [Methylibium sp. NZG]